MPASGEDPGGPAPTSPPTTATTSPPATAPATKAPTGPRTSTLKIDDRTGDTVVDGTGQARPQNRADLVQSQANYTSKALLFAAQTAERVDPKNDPMWNSDSTFLSWEIDTNGDSTVDYEVQYFFADGGLVAGVSRPGDENSQSVCGAEAAYTADGYTVAIDPNCLGNPATFWYRVTMYYATDPANQNGESVTDVAPDSSLSRPVSRP